MEKDILKKYLAHNNQVRVILINATKMVQDARDTHELSNVATAALGRTIMATTIMASMLKNKQDRITVRIKGDGQCGNIVVCSDNTLKTKGYISNPSVEIPLKSNGKLDVSGIIGKGYLNIVKDIGMKEPYVGFSELITSEIAEDFAYYFSTSEQTPSVVSLGVNIDVDQKVGIACGYIIQPLPECEESVIDIIESINLNLPSVTNLMADLGNIDDVAKTITGDNDIVLMLEEDVNYECDCNSARIEKAIIALGKNEIDDVIAKNGRVEVTCEFCNKVYSYNKQEVDKLFK